MASVMKSLKDYDECYVKGFQLYLERSNQHDSMTKFLQGPFSDLLASVGEGKAKVNVFGVGSASGELDLEILAQLHQRHPSVLVDNEVIEPSAEQIDNYKVLVSNRPDLDYITFNWNVMTALQFEQNWKEGMMNKKADFIHMLQLLYHLDDPVAAVRFYQSLLSDTGKLIVTLAAGTSGRDRLWRMHRTRLSSTHTNQYITMRDIKSQLDSKSVAYSSYQVPVYLDITECFEEGNEHGEQLLEWLTQVKDFSQVAPAELRAALVETLRHPDCSTEKDGRILFDNSIEALVLDPVPLEEDV